LEADRATAESHSRDPTVIGDHRVLRDDVLGVLGERLEGLPRWVNERRRVTLGIYSGLRFGLVLRPEFSPEVFLEGAATRFDTLSRDHHGPRAVLNALERLAEGFASEIARAPRFRLSPRRSSATTSLAFGAPLAHEQYHAALTTLRDPLKMRLAGMTTDEAVGELPEASDLADRIQALTAAHKISGTPERVTRGTASAAEPITERIRRRAGGVMTPVVITHPGCRLLSAWNC
jgi:hypothetical protein